MKKLSEMHTEMDKDERRIVLKLISDILKAGHKISVYDGGEWVVNKSQNKNFTFQNMYSTDQDILAILRYDNTKIGSISLIYGNGADVLSDYTANDEMEQLVAGARKLYETL